MTTTSSQMNIENFHTTADSWEDFEQVEKNNKIQEPKIITIRHIHPSLQRNVTPLVRTEHNPKTKSTPKDKEKFITLQKSSISNPLILKDKGRSDAFTVLGDKDKIAEKLKCTKKCSYVNRIENSQHFTKCTRNNCNFAHTKEQWNPPSCQFGDSCYSIHGRRDRSGNIDQDNVCRFIHTSESVEDWVSRTQQDFPDLPTDSEYKSVDVIDNGRSEAFSVLGDKDKIAQKLKCTKKCSYVNRIENTNKFSKCTRNECNFAHTKDQWNPPSCQFGDSCYSINGKRDRAGNVDTQNVCKFIHTSESLEHWMSRTHQNIPDLPTDSEYNAQIDEPKLKIIEDKITTKNIMKVPNEDIARKVVEEVISKGIFNFEIKI
jgi:hypothetical protein